MRAPRARPERQRALQKEEERASRPLAPPAGWNAQFAIDRALLVAVALLQVCEHPASTSWASDPTLELPHNVGGTAPHAFTRATEAGMAALRASVVVMVPKEAQETAGRAPVKKQAEVPVSRIHDSALLAR